MANNLQAPSSIRDLRTQAHMNLSVRLESLDLTPLLIYTLASNIPASILPYLIWQYDMMIPATAMQFFGVSTLAIIQAALPLHKISGTPGAIIQSLELCGFSDVTILEGQASWGGTSYPASQGWAVFRVSMGGVSAGGLYSAETSGAVNGSNRLFTVAALPVSPSLRVFYNGALQRPVSDFTSVGEDITLNFAPTGGTHPDVVSAAYRTGALSSAGLNNIAVIANFFKAARCLLDSVVISYPAFFDAVVPTVSGSNLVLPHTPTSLELYRNGIYQTQGVDFTLSGATVTPTIAIGSDSFIAWGTYAGSSTAASFYDYVTPTEVGIDGTTFAIPIAPASAASLRLYRNGILQTAGGVDYTLTGSTIVFNTALVSTDRLVAFYRG